MQLIRFKVIRASRLIAGLIIALLVIILAVIVTRLVIMEQTTPASLDMGNSKMVLQTGPDQGNETEVVAAFAAAPSLSGGGDGGGDNSIEQPDDENALFSPSGERIEEIHENEHSDENVPQMIIEKIPYDLPQAEAEPSPSPTALPSSGKVTAVPDPTEKPAPKRVLIYHTHTHESYEQEKSDPYKMIEPWRTTDQEHSIVKVGSELARLLEGYGIEVVHDKTDHEPPKLGTAYTRSLDTLEKYEKKGEHFDCYIDLHRDAFIEGQVNKNVTLKSTGKQCAQLMMLIGNGDGFNEKPFYTENMRFARQVTLALNEICSGICKEVLVKKGRYNQHIGKQSMVVEVGNNMNTLSEAVNAMPALAQALSEVLSGEVFLQ